MYDYDDDYGDEGRSLGRTIWPSPSVSSPLPPSGGSSSGRGWPTARTRRAARSCPPSSTTTTEPAADTSEPDTTEASTEASRGRATETTDRASAADEDSSTTTAASTTTTAATTTTVAPTTVALPPPAAPVPYDDRCLTAARRRSWPSSTSNRSRSPGRCLTRQPRTDCRRWPSPTPSRGRPTNVANLLTINPAVPRSVGVRVVELTSARFPEGSAEMLPPHALELDRAVGIMNALPNITALVIGHADQRGDELANYALSEQRAERGRGTTWPGSGIAPSRLSSRAVGEADLLTLNNDAAALALNRRTEFVFYGLLIEVEPLVRAVRLGEYGCRRWKRESSGRWSLSTTAFGSPSVVRSSASCSASSPRGAGGSFRSMN